MKLSRWHGENTKPVHVGVYEIQYDSQSTYTKFSFFDGKFWRGWKEPCDFKHGDIPCKISFIISGQRRQWRGIVKDKK